MTRRFYVLRILTMLIGVFALAIGAKADDFQMGEWATLADGTPAMVGQTTNDHLFTRNSFNDGGEMLQYDNVVSFKSGEYQIVWLWLDDDEIYLNEKVQALPPTLIKDGGSPYNEITYNSFQCNVYLPMSVEMVSTVDAEGNEVQYMQGDRMPNSSEFSFNELSHTKVIDGVTYRVYKIIVTNSQNNGTHFSARNANRYLSNGALKKNDAPLLGIILRNSNQSAEEGRLADMIIANQEFGMREPMTVVPKWEPNEYRFIYGIGGNNESQRFQFYNRVELYGSKGFSGGSIKITNLSLDCNSKEINIGDEFQLTATVLPENASNKTLKWTSSNPNIATVSNNGNVKAISAGIAIITATTTDGSNLSVTCKVTVIDADAEDKQTGEWATLADGSPAMLGQTMNDHIFVRMDNNGVTQDNVIVLNPGMTQTVWLWLDDDEIYLNEKVQALPPTLIKDGGTPYNEITYNSFQCDIYLPMSVQIIKTENADGDEVMFVQGDRMPNSAEFTFGEHNFTKVIDGITYRVYTLIVSNKQYNGTHFSAKNATRYLANGALKKDDAPLLGIFLKNNNSAGAEGQLADMIIANQEFGMREPLTVEPKWEPNEYRFIYGTGGNNETQRFQRYNRVSLYNNRTGLVTSLTLDATNKELYVGNSFQLTATVLPEDASNKKLSWTSSNPNIATVNSQGLVTAISAGTATITAMTTDGSNIKATCQVTVKNVMASSIALNTSLLTLEVDETSQLTAIILPSNASNKTVVWNSTNNSIASVDNNGMVYAISPGTVYITATTTDGSNLSATCKVIVNKRKVTSISLNLTNLLLYVNQSSQLTAIIYPNDADNKTVIWSSSDPSVASVSNNGLVTAIAMGTTTITATTTDGSNLSASCNVTVRIIPATSISLNQTELTLDVSDTFGLVASVMPSNATYKTVAWYSSNPSVATVSSNGMVTPKAPGNVTIIATTTDGTNLSASCQVNVVKMVKSLALNESNLTLILPEEAQLIASITPQDATNKTLTWTSSNTAVATVDDYGFVTPVAVGTTIIRASTTDGSNLSATCIITVKRQLVTSVTLNQTMLQMHIGETSQLIAFVSPNNASNKELNWSSANSSIATVDNNGLVTAISGGTTYIKATSTDGSNISASCMIEVIPDYYLSLDTLSHIRGSSEQIVDLAVSLVNKKPISGIQFDVSLPSTVSFNLIDDSPDIWLDEARRTRSHSVFASQLSNGKYRVLVTSSSSKDLKGNEGELVHMNLVLPRLHNLGNQPIVVSNVIASESDETRHTLDNASTLLRFYYIVGDADANAIVDIADHVSTSSKILGKYPSPFYSDAADVDGNSTLDVVDLVGITNIALEIKPISLRQAPTRGSVEDKLFCDNLVFNAEHEAEVTLGIDCGFNFAGFQMDINLPRGLSLTSAELGENATELGMALETQLDGTIRILGTSFSDAEVSGVCPELLRFKLKADRNYIHGSNIDFSDIIFAERNLTPHYFDGSSVEYVERSSIYELIEDVRIYVEDGNIIVDTPIEGTVQIIAVDGRMAEYHATVGHNVYVVGVHGIYLVHFNGKTLKVRL